MSSNPTYSLEITFSKLRNFLNIFSRVRGRTEYAQRAPKRSTSVSDVPTFRSSLHNQLNTSPPYTPPIYPITKFHSSFSSSPSLHNAPFQQAESANLTQIPTDTDTTATPPIDSQTIGSISYTEDTD